MMMKTLTKTILACTMLTAVSSLSTILLVTKASAAELKINVSSISSEQGHLLVALFSGEDSYNSGESKWSSRVKVTGDKEEVIFSDLPEGEYAVKMYHDENDNMALDTNILGIPSEGYGFSNNGGRFGQPEYKKASFKVKENTSIDIRLF